MGTFTLRTASGTSALRPPSSPDHLRPRTMTAGWHVYVNGVEDVSRIDLASLRIADSGPGAASRLSATHVDQARTMDIPARAAIEVIDGNAATYWSGRVIGRQRRLIAPAGWLLAIEASDLTPDLDASVIVSDATPAGWEDRRVVAYLVSRYAYTGVTAPDLTVAVTNLSMPALTFVDTTLAKALTQVGDAAGTDRSWWLDVLNRVVYGYTTISAAPYAISDAPNLTTTIPARDIEYETDESDIINAVWVEGPADPDTGLPVASGWVEDATSIGLYGRRETTLVNSDATTAQKVTLYGSAYLARVKDPKVRGSLRVTGYHGWASGQALTITNVALGLSDAVFAIKAVDTTFLDGTGKRDYLINFGELSRSLVRLLAAG